MFHIPMNKRESIQSYRYSIPGYPCLYLANQGSLCWFECGMPNSFFISEFRLSYKYKELNILNLARPSRDIAWVIKNNYDENNKEKDDRITKQCIGTLFFLHQIQIHLLHIMLCFQVQV